MVDERVVSVKLEQIEQYYSELKTKQETLSREEFLLSTTEQRAVERMFENAIQACADLAQHIASQAFGFDGTTSKGAIRVLDCEGVIDEETADTLVAAIGFRNVLAHEYGHGKPSIDKRTCRLTRDVARSSSGRRRSVRRLSPSFGVL
ncbi:DUF86 domain-containing protein [Halorubrum ezzemoulense]|uniref:type VII toxin-antitoxin system HepT family RNase toxin n=1 Tax=Halorubrum ezzemoulense TaxID=337243 RepID=UPI00232D0A7B|nr:DUF86 domain-containing protein [Halorubrum ezzemoulense]MDB2265810.1 DUF86 domain-containing protein [Halorubrum ezzemoulense]